MADGGTRTASITGGWVALSDAINWCKAKGLLDHAVEVNQVAAISLGIVSGDPLLDLCYEEDSTADFDLNLVSNGAGEIIEVQGTGESRAITADEFQGLLKLGQEGIAEILRLQKEVLA